MSKGVTFEKIWSKVKPVAKETVALEDLAVNHVRFVILDELKPD